MKKNEDIRTMKDYNLDTKIFCKINFNMSEFKIYTKLGDKGETSLIGGKRVPKYHQRIEAYGTLDELNSFIGLLRDQNIDESLKKVLIKIQDRIFTVESLLATDHESEIERDLPKIHEDDIKFWKIK